MEKRTYLSKKNSVSLSLNPLVLKVNELTERQGCGIAMTKIDKFENEIT